MPGLKGSVTVQNPLFKWGEVKQGTNRGIRMHRDGVANDSHTYFFNPNPHNADKTGYNKNQQGWYIAAATQIATLFAHNNNWSDANAQVTVNGVAYSLDV